jgi:hypothetical protein
MGRSGKSPDCRECERLENLLVEAAADCFVTSMTFYSLEYTDPRTPCAISTMLKAMSVKEEYQRRFNEHAATHERAWRASAAGLEGD